MKDFLILAAVVWMLRGYANLETYIKTEGWPDRETHDGPEVDWIKSMQLIALLLSLGPILNLAGYLLRKAVKDWDR